MKLLFISLLLLAGASSAQAQTYPLGYDATVLKNYGIFKKGAKVHLKSYRVNQQVQSGCKVNHNV